MSADRGRPVARPRTDPGDQVFSLFPTPVSRAAGALPQPLVDRLVEHFLKTELQDNNSSPNLSHTRTLQPGDSPLLLDVTQLIHPKLTEFGALLFGEPMGWAVKEMWVNVLDSGGRQAMHNHANSFVSGIVYLTPVDPSSQTVFMKSPGGNDYVFKNDHAGVTTGPFNAEKWISPPPRPGDLLLFPSYLLHAVPPNAGQRRITLSFNAIPRGLESWGYRVQFSG